MKISKTINAPNEFVYNQILIHHFMIFKNTGRRPDIKSPMVFNTQNFLGKINSGNHHD